MSSAARAVRGALWSAAGSWSQVALNLAGVAVIARWASPHAYGVFGAATVLTSMVSMMCCAAFGESITQRTDLEDGHLDVTFLTMLVLTVLATGSIWPFASELANKLGAPHGGAVVRALCCLVPLSALSAVPLALLERDLRFRELAQIGCMSALLSNVVGIALALAGAGVWALVAMEVIRGLVCAVGGWRATVWRPGRRGSVRHFRELSTFNFQVLVTYAIGHLDGILPRAMIGATMGAQILGLYLLASRVFEELSRLVTGPLSGIAMASTARARPDNEAVRQVVMGLYQSSTLLALPVFLGLMVVAPIAIPWMFGAQWAPAVIALQILLMGGLRTATGVFNIAILRAMGRADLPIALLATGALLNAVMIPLLAPLGLAGAALAVLIRTFGTWPLGCLFIRRATGIAIRTQLSIGGPAMISALLMAGTCAATLRALPAEVPVPATLALICSLGALIYIGTLQLISPVTVARALGLIRSALTRNGRSLAT